MREIKFRAWDKEEKKMILSEKVPYEYMFGYEGNGVKCFRNDCYCDSFGDEHDNWTELDNIMQYTGLKDKNGKEIYEGDIVTFTDGHDGYLTSEQYCEGIVNWEDETASFQLTGRIEAESYECLEECEIIGNIYENPEPLKE